MWSFNRLIDAPRIETKEIKWQGPFSWTGYENQNNLDKIPDIEGVYLWTFRYRDDYIIYDAGMTSSTKKKSRSHTLKFRNGNYTVMSDRVYYD